MSAVEVALIVTVVLLVLLVAWLVYFTQNLLQGQADTNARVARAERRDRLQPPRPGLRSLHFAGPAMDVNGGDSGHRRLVHALTGLSTESRLLARYGPTPIYDQVRRDHCPHEHTVDDTPLCSATLDRLCLDCGQTWSEPRCDYEDADR